MMPPSDIRLSVSTDTDLLVALLHDADESDDRIRRFVDDPAHTGYTIRDGVTVVGAVLMDWQPDESEIIYIAIEPAYRGKGYGKQAMRLILEEAHARKTRSVIVGTANSGLDQIAFYQKCGFRIDSVRKDYFDYFTEPVFENGIQIRDMLVLRYLLTD